MNTQTLMLQCEHLRDETLKDAGNGTDTLLEAACVKELSVEWGLQCLDGISVLLLENSPLHELKIQCQKRGFKILWRRKLLNPPTSACDNLGILDVTHPQVAFHCSKGKSCRYGVSTGTPQGQVHISNVLSMKRVWKSAPAGFPTMPLCPSRNYIHFKDK